MLERSFDAPRNAVWRAFTDPEAMARWMWAGLGANPRATVDLRPGGAYRVAIDEEPGKDGWESGERAFQGAFVVVEAPEHLVYTLRWDAPVGYNQMGHPVTDERVDVVFEGDGPSTLIRYTHAGIPDDGVSIDGHRAATEAMFDILDRLLASS